MAQQYRIAQDHFPLWSFNKSNDGQGGYGAGVADVIEWVADLTLSKYTKEFAYPDLDFLMTSYPLTMGYINSRTEFTFWAAVSSPLLVATDMRNLSPEKYSIIANPEVIAINQDDSSTSADRVRKDANGGQLWVRPLANGDKAVILYNSRKSSGDNITVSFTPKEVGFQADDRIRVRRFVGAQRRVYHKLLSTKLTMCAFFV